MRHRSWSIASLFVLSSLGALGCLEGGGGPEGAQGALADGDALALSADPGSLAPRRAARERQARDPAAPPHVERLSASRRELGLGDADTFQPISVERAEDGLVSVRLQHYHRGLRVRGSVVISHADAKGRFGEITGSLKAGINLPTEPALSEAEALRVAEADPSRSGSYSREPEIELLIHPIVEAFDAATGERARPEAVSWEEGAAPPAINAEQISRRVTGYALAYEITTVEGLEGHGEEVAATRYLVDAQRGEVLEKRSLLHNGSGTSLYNGAVTFNTLGTWGGPVGSVMYDWEREFRVVDDDYDADEVPNVDTDDTWGDGMIFTGSSMANRQTAMVDAIFGASVYWDLLSNVFGRQGPDDDYYGVNVFVHVGDNYSNAYYSPLSGNISCGDGPGNGWTFTSLEVLGHESGHALNDFTAGLDGGEADGLNESSSDIFATLSSFYRGGGGYASHSATIPSTGGDWVIDTVGRNMMRPSIGGQPDAWYSGIDALDEHDSAAPNNRAFYFLAQGATSGMKDDSYSRYLPLGMQGVGVHKAAQIWYRALTHYMVSSTDYVGARDACINAAKDLFGLLAPEVDAARNAYAGINVGTKASGYPAVPTMAESEPNDNTVSADVLTRPVTPKPNGGPDKLHVDGNGTGNDYFVYGAAAGEKILVRLTSSPSHDYDVYLLDSFGAVLQQSTLATGREDYVSWTATSNVWNPGAPTYYYIKIVPYTAGAGSWYDIDLDFT